MSKLKKLIAQATLVRDEIEEAENSAERVGGLMEDIITETDDAITEIHDVAIRKIDDVNSGWLFDTNDILTGYEISDGEQKANNNYCITSLIAINANRRVYVRSYKNRLHCYDADRNYLGYVVVTDAGIIPSDTEQVKDTAYVRIEWQNQQVFMLSYSRDWSITKNPVDGYLRKMDNGMTGNLIDPLSLIQGWTPQSNTGGLRPDPGFWTTPFIKVDPTRPIYMQGVYGPQVYCFDKDLSFIGRIQQSGQLMLSAISGYAATVFVMVIGKIGQHDNPFMGYGTNHAGKSTAPDFCEISEQYRNVSTDIIKRNQDTFPIISAVAYANSSHVAGYPRVKLPTFIQFSDVHGDYQRTKNVFDFLDKVNEIDFAVFNGDMQYQYWGDGKNGYESSIGACVPDATKPVLICVGNHDAGLNDNVRCSLSDMFDKYIAPNIVNLGLEASHNNLYYYKDFNDTKLRIVVLNEYDTPRTINPNNSSKYLSGYDMWRRFISQAQTDWLVSVLSSTTKSPIHGLPDDYSVVIALHQLPAKIDFLDDPFVDQNSSKVSTPDYKTNQDVTLLFNIVDAFISKTTLNKTYAPKSNVTNQTVESMGNVTVNADFSDRVHSNFVCWLNGHVHMDLVGTIVDATNRQVVITVTNQALDYPENYDGLARIVDSKAEDAFNVISINNETRKIRIVRVGNNMPNNLIKREFTEIGY